jgi:hypothetical protein
MSKNTTRKELITIKYNELQKELKQFIAVDIFPSLDDIDVADLIFYLALTFPGGPNDDYRTQLKNILSCHNLEYSEEDFNKIYSIVNHYIIWFKTLK